MLVEGENGVNKGSSSFCSLCLVGDVFQDVSNFQDVYPTHREGELDVISNQISDAIVWAAPPLKVHVIFSS